MTDANEDANDVEREVVDADRANGEPGATEPNRTGEEQAEANRRDDPPA